MAKVDYKRSQKIVITLAAASRKVWQAITLTDSVINVRIPEWACVTLNAI
jgi:hypothetical protein